MSLANVDANLRVCRLVLKQRKKIISSKMYRIEPKTKSIAKITLLKQKFSKQKIFLI